MPVENQNWRELLKQCFYVNLAATVAIVSYRAIDGSESVLSAKLIVSSFVYSNCIGTLISIIIFYVSSRWANNSKIVRLVKVSASIFLATYVGFTIARFILGIIFPPLAEPGLLPGRHNFVFALGIAFAVGFGVYFFEISQASLRQSLLEAEKAKTLATQAQLASLESRIHPHFLFNTLNSIAALIREDPAASERMVERLSALLRYSLDSNSKSLVPLTQELEITRKYLEIEKVRFGSRLRFEIKTYGEIAHVKLPPLALQSLVENSIKHVASVRSAETSVGVLVRVEGRRLIIEVSDNGPGFTSKSLIEGHGLDLLQKRLTVIFGETANITIGNGSVQLHIPYDSCTGSAENDHRPTEFHREVAL